MSQRPEIRASSFHEVVYSKSSTYVQCPIICGRNRLTSRLVTVSRLLSTTPMC